jgi:hypothetical protein
MNKDRNLACCIGRFLSIMFFACAAKEDKRKSPPIP